MTEPGATPQRITTPDGRSLDLWLAGPPDGDPLVFHAGTPGAGVPFGWHVRCLAERGLRYGEWLAAHLGNARRHLFPDQGHLTLVVDAYPQILDELLAGAG